MYCACVSLRNPARLAANVQSNGCLIRRAKTRTGGSGSWRGIGNSLGYIHRRQRSGRSRHEVRVPPHRRREHHKCNNNDPEPTHSSKQSRNRANLMKLLTNLRRRTPQEGPMTTVWIYVDTNKEVGDVDHLKVFATPELADEWFKENDPEGVAFGYEVIEE